MTRPGPGPSATGSQVTGGALGSSSQPLPQPRCIVAGAQREHAVRGRLLRNRQGSGQSQVTQCCAGDRMTRVSALISWPCSSAWVSSWLPVAPRMGSRIGVVRRQSSCRQLG